jgi:serine/threonine-protein kinase HipA
MKRCPITYETISDQQDYSQRGLRLLSSSLKNLKPLELSAAEQRREAIARVGKMSIQGIQPKLSAQLKITEQHFEIVDKNGNYILKTQSESYPELPENEALTMSLAATIGIEIPVHGLVYSKDNSMTYFIKRFDRVGHNKKLPIEDFAQLLGLSRDTKYESSMERVAKVIADYCSFPKIEFVILFKLTLFNFLIGNEDMHLKNFSLITRDQKITLSPAYDLLNTTIILKNPEEELALTLNGKKRNLKKRDFFDYFAKEKLGLNQNIINGIIQEIQQAIPDWEALIANSFLSKLLQEKYINLLEKRRLQLEI